MFDFLIKIAVAVIAVQLVFLALKRPKPRRSRSFSYEKYLTTERLEETCKKPELGTIFTLYTFALYGKSPVQEKAVAEIETRLSAVPAQELFLLDQSMRKREYSMYGEYESLEKLAQLKPLFSGHFRAYALLASHPNGYIREKVLREIAEDRTGLEIPFIILRTADWVEPIRRLAQGMMAERLVPQQAPFLVSNLSLLLRAANGRSGTAELLEKLGKFLSTPEGQKILVEAVESGDPENRRICLGYLDPSQSATLKKVFQDPDERIRLLAAKKMTERPADFSAEIAQLADDTHPFLRSFYLEWLGPQNSPGLEDQLRRFLVDSNRTIRGTARFQWRKLGKADFREDYLRVLEGGTARQKAAALLGLGEINAVDLAGKILGFVDAGHPRVEAAAIKTLSAFGLEKYRDIFRRKMLGPKGKAAKLALKAFGRLPGAVTLTSLETLVKEGLTPGSALTLADHLPEWDRVFWYLRSIQKGDEQVAERARARLGQWFQSGFAQAPFPAKDRAVEIKELLESLGGKLPEQSVRKLLFALGQN